MLTNKLLEPFKEICELVPDLNTKRARIQGQWIFTEEPLNWKEKFPRITVKAENVVVKEHPNQAMPADTQFTYSISYNIKIIYFAKRMDEFECPDGVKRKGKLLVEFMGINFIIPTILKNKHLICRKYDWLEIVNVNTTGEITDVNKYGIEQTFNLSVFAKFTDMLPISNDSYIKTINQDITTNENQ